ncbi:hypothetical protein A4A49_09441 [Nicotiana attenuata]|uniref:Uncharacterized protein n=1 Tax=Nicotiana attenuata TaxID=49451 RepID=A0A314L5K1_NICAT|nr:hypothetical protein A4A49_09441 [Nicotiana attenuata]
MLGWKVEYKPRYSLVSKHIAKMRTDKLYLKNISPTELEKEIMIKDVLFLANGPEKENTRDTTDKVMRNEKVDEDATGNENVIEDVKEKCNKKENMNEQTNSRGELNVKEKELLMEREVFDETYIKRFNTYVDCSSPPRHIFDKHIRDSGNLISLY